MNYNNLICDVTGGQIILHLGDQVVHRKVE